MQINDRPGNGEAALVARVDQVPEPGDYLAVDLFGEALVITRDEAGALHALSRVCRHRFMDVLPEEQAPRQGNLPRLTCPYHTWTYRLDGRYAGQLTGAPLMHKVDFDRAACRLPAFALEVWNGFIMVNLDRDAGPLAPRLAGPTERLRAYGLSDWLAAETLTWTGVEANWKVAVENGSESYHHIGTHAESLQPMLPGQATRVDDCDGAWFSMFNPVGRDASAGEEDGHGVVPTLFPPVPGLSAEQRSGLLVIGVFPLLVLTVMPDHAAWFRWLPTGPTTHDAQITVLVPPGARSAPDYAETLAAYRDVYDQVQTEDLVMIRGVQRGLGSATTSGGRFSHLERPLWQFHRYLSRALASPAAAAEPVSGQA
ncbi:aromatic ring-hydroxylating oxygenase subunit alpha [Actinomadura chibensis]|uniref:Aromatic ring-hydroxylating dioxygenase subunit alpha n=1 Tax=Actinomadura chibensis TaxID=392828 RepID=A0A5D0NBM6_9ACTN|nr:aromatic ring-hydroxylating dioxygenase subunit alpha [Actinomadura chibensis]TYB41850.1 aromatic ring-hydroxylating dioxygenase subunit alpha [Actinomadura chibensis]